MMRRTRAGIGRLIGLTIATLAMTSIWHPASATNYGLYVGDTFTLDGLSFTVTACSYQAGTASAGSCGTSASYSDLIIPTVSTHGAIFNVMNNQGAAIFSVPTAVANSVYELAYTLSVTVPSGASVNASTLSVWNGTTALTTGSAAVYSGTASAAVNGGKAPGTGGSLLSTLNVTAAAPSVTNTFAAITSTSTPGGLSVNVDLKLVGAGTSLALAGIGQSFNPAPEPVTLGIFLVGLAGLGAVRRRTPSRGAALAA